MEGYLWKRGKKDGKFLLRKFVLSEDTLRYYVKEVCHTIQTDSMFRLFCVKSQKTPKTSIKIAALNLNFCPNKITNPNGLQLTWSKDGKTRSIFVYSESGKVIINLIFKSQINLI